MDMIDKRNQREKIARSIIKRRNVIYSPEAYTGPVSEEQTTNGPQTMAQEPAAPASHETGASAEALEVLARLEREAAEDEAAKRAEIERAVAQQEEQQLAISRILNEKEADRQRAMDEARGK